MLLHYIRISLRNLNKYKTQTAISIVSMAVSIMLLAIVSTILLSFKTSPLLSQPYADRVEQYAMNWSHRAANAEERDLILNHKFKSVEAIHFSTSGQYNLRFTTNPGNKDEKTILVYGRMKDKDHMRFLGMKSTVTGQPLGDFSDKEIVITDWLAKKLFPDENPIGSTVSIELQYFNEFNGNYIVKDVIAQASQGDEFMSNDEHVVFFPDHIVSDTIFLYFVLREGASREELTKELKELLPGREFMLFNVKDTYDQSKDIAIRNGIILFLFLFVLVAFFNYIRQQTQLFRLREREVALRTCIGSQPFSLSLLFAAEICIVLLLTAALALFLIWSLSAFLLSDYSSLTESYDFSVGKAMLISLIAISILTLISIMIVWLTVKRIRQDQTGLALRMKPRPGHGFRNVGMTLQMSVCILFTWISVLLFLSVDNIKNWYGIPDNVERYKRSLRLILKGASEEDSRKIFDRIESLESVEKVYSYEESMMTYDDNNGEFPNLTYYNEIQQQADDIQDFFNINIEKIAGEIDSLRYVYVSKDFKEMLKEKNQWNGKTVTLPYRGDGVYQIKGVYDKIPFKLDFDSKSVIITDKVTPILFEPTRIIVARTGMAGDARNAIEAIIHEELPTILDNKSEDYLNIIAPGYTQTKALMVIIYILSAISAVTTIASIYAGVALDTRRRRKEMALRKLNGAGRKVIAMIFLRVYIAVIAIAALIALPLGLIFVPKYIGFYFAGIDICNLIPAFIIALLLIIAVTALTIAWKIRNVMTADPIEYLKELSIINYQ